MTDPTCPSCNTPWTSHLDREALCREVERLRDLLAKADRLLSVCEFTATEDLADLEGIAKGTS